MTGTQTKTVSTQTGGEVKYVCGHVGQLQSAGLIPIETPGGMFIVVALYCKNCGEIALKANKIEIKGKLPGNEQTTRVDKSKDPADRASSPTGKDNA